MDFGKAGFEQIITHKGGGGDCECGREHATGLVFASIRPGATDDVPEALSKIGITRPFVVCDENTYKAAWPALEAVLAKARVGYALYTLRGGRVEPDERSIGSLTMAFDRRCDGIIGVGAGTINDCCKVLAGAAGVPFMIYATAPSMDGYASNLSSMLRDGVKVSLYNACPAAIIGDIDIVRGAPLRMLWAGFGDMAAKYVSICEWRIAHIVTGEYYCENIAGLVRAAVAKIMQNARKLAERDPDAVQAVMEGLVLSGVAMSFATVSRPASSLEHSFSHVWEMSAHSRGEASDLHGIQVGIGTLLSLKTLEHLREVSPDREKALGFVAALTNERWEAQTRKVFGESAQTLIDAEYKSYHKNDPLRHAARLERICEYWRDITRVIDEELPPSGVVEGLMRELGMPVTPGDIGVKPDDVLAAFVGSRDIRDKYLSSSLIWDLGLLYEDWGMLS